MCRRTERIREEEGEKREEKASNESREEAQNAMQGYDDTNSPEGNPSS